MGAQFADLKPVVPPVAAPAVVSPPIRRDVLMSATVARHARPLPACAKSGQRAKTFLMVFMGHSGSTAMLSELGAHSKIHVENPELVDHQAVFNTKEALKTTRDFFDRGLRHNKMPGFKIRPRHLLNEPEKWLKLVKEYDTRIIWQYRQNFVKTAIGEYKLRKLNDTSVIEGFKKNVSSSEQCSMGKCSFPVTDFQFLHKLFLHNSRTQREILKGVSILSRNGCVREAPYEDYLYSREGTLRDVFRFLGVDFESTQPTRFKATSDNLCTVVENWEALCRTFYVCPGISHMLDDERNSCFCPVVSGPAGTQFLCTL